MGRGSPEERGTETVSAFDSQFAVRNSQPKLTYTGLGSNMGDRLDNLRRGLVALAKLSNVLQVSSVYETEPWGRGDQAWFLNAVVLLETELRPLSLLRALKSEEARFHRDKGRWGPRELDMDILLYEGVEMKTQDLTIPHPRMGERSFVLSPLEELFRAGAPSLGYRITNPCPDGKGIRLFSGPEALVPDFPATRCGDARPGRPGAST